MKTAGLLLEFFGNLFPDATGIFEEEGLYNGQSYFHNTVAEFFHWWDADSELWEVTKVLGSLGTYDWSAVSMISASYMPGGTATGTGDMQIDG